MELSIIIVEYHCMDLVYQCVASIQQQLNNIQFECLVVSNSQYTSAEIANYRNILSSVNLIDTKLNKGYAGGVNAGIKHASGRYIYVVNPDCLLTDSSVQEIINRMDDDLSWAISGPMVMDENKKVQPSCRRFPKLWTFLLVRSVLTKLPLAKHEYNRYMMTDYDHKSVREVDWVSGGATLIKASVLPEIGGMDERYFLYMEDVDWCRSAWMHGYKVAYCPVSVVVHAGQHQSINSSINLFKNRHLRWHLTSLIRYFIKYRFREKPDSAFYKKTISTHRM